MTSPAAQRPTLDEQVRRPAVDVATERIYRRLVRGDHATGPSGRIALCVYTTTLRAGRGDLFVAAGLARALVERGWGVRFVPRWRWKERIADVDVVVSLLEDFDPGVISGDIPAVAWVRNQTDVWRQSPRLALYDLVLSSSELSLSALRRTYDGPTGLVPIGVDPDLFTTAGGGSREAVSTSVNHWSADRDLHKALTEAPSDVPIAWYGDPKYLGAALRRHSLGAVSYFALPAAYRHSLLVLDDMNSTTLPYGNVNSRIFEALGAGALPVTNGALGLAELGLSEIPVYRSPAQLRALIAELRSDPEGTVARAERLRAVVLERHTFDQRAEALLAALPAARERCARNRDRVTIASYPPSEGNPFPRLLYSAAEGAGARTVPTWDPTRFPRDTGATIRNGVLHVHWTSPLLQPAEGPFDARRRLDAFCAAIDDFRSRGGRLFWTVHNLLPHDGRYRVLEIELARFLADRADLVHVLGPATAVAAEPLFTLRPERTTIIEHCSYLGVYPDFVGREEARRRVGLLDGEIALLLLGEIRPYKGLHLLLPAFEEALATDPRLRLIVAGRAGAQKALQPWLDRARHHRRVLTHFDYVPDAELQIWLRAADVAVLPYPVILNSGALQLAHSFDLPVVAPAAGEVGRALDPRCAIGFQPGDQADLVRAILRAADELTTPEATEAARDFAGRRPPEIMAAEFLVALRGQVDASMPGPA